MILIVSENMNGMENILQSIFSDSNTIQLAVSFATGLTIGAITRVYQRYRQNNPNEGYSWMPGGSVAAGVLISFGSHGIPAMYIANPETAAVADYLGTKIIERIRKTD
jgi:hypothetical protein